MNAENLPPFCIDEWVACACGCICDAPYHLPGRGEDKPELVLGQSLPWSAEVPEGEWRTGVLTHCPRCGVELRAVAVFHGRTLRALEDPPAS